MKVQGLLSKMLALVAQNLGMGFGFYEVPRFGVKHLGDGVSFGGGG